MTLKVEHSFNPSTYRHYVNGHETVLHCHHYMSLTTKLAQDFESIGGTRILRETAEDTIFAVLDSYIKQNGIQGGENRLSVGKEYFSVMGLGRLEVTGNEGGGQVTLLRSHVDQGWKVKYGTAEKAVGHFNQGYAIAMFRAAFERPPRSYKATETKSIVTGEEQGVILVDVA